MFFQTKWNTFLLLTTVMLASCGGAGGGEGGTRAEAAAAVPGNSNATSNTSPISHAGSDQVVSVGAEVNLNGEASSDPDADSISYQWSIDTTPDRSEASLTRSNAVDPSFTADLKGTYRINLVVSDGEKNSSTDSVVIEAVQDNNVPIANAGSDQAVSVGALVALNGEDSNDADSHPITFAWAIISRPNNSAIELSRSDIVNPTFTVDLAGTYIFQLVVNDGIDNSVADSVTVQATEVNLAPVANAGGDQNIATSSLVTLDGSGSFDNNGDSFSFLWALITKPSGSAAALNNATSESASFTADLEGSYVIQLTVNDGELSSNPDTVSVNFVTVNQKPLADAGADQIVSNPLVLLDGSGSSDPEGAGLSYAWSLISRPNGSSAVLSNSTSADPSFTADSDGSYVWSLVVNDGELASDADTITVNYEPINQKPIANAGLNQVVSNATVQLDGSGSSDPEGDDLSYVWSMVSRPTGSGSILSSSTIVNPTFTADIEGRYVWSLVVNDGISGESDSDSVSIDYEAPSSGSFIDEFDGVADRSNYVINNASSLPDVETTGGRYRANLVDNTNEVTLHFNAYQGRLDAWLTRFPFEFIARNIGIGTQADSQTPQPYIQNAFAFAGVQVHSTSLDSPNSAHVVVGHRGSVAQYTIEGKNTVNGSSSVNDIGSNVVPNARADIRVVGASDGSLRVYWQLPNENIGVQSDSWRAYNGSGYLPGRQADFGGDGSAVYVGLITYAYRTTGLPFVGTCDSIEIIED